MELRLIVIRTPNPQQLADFYTQLGLVFDYHQHGNSPYHYGASIGQTLIEIYPLTKSQTEADKNLRLGFAMEQFDDRIAVLKEKLVPFATEPVQTEFGYMAVVIDPDGRKVELYKD
ncbi:VOC family protein [Paraflavitalea pollutisoli]|uniref:VOC family protein n=1 Tax=Paraflavitalea pollutisoli TaxID=3034143 RepID=UPI0023ED21AC|nr:VOC family protein [Paraflavitalea sp. H1-2-19X]